MGKLYDEYLEKRRKNKQRIAKEWNEENPDQKISAADLAPVKSRKDEEDKGYFNKGLLEDGYDRFDISKTILGTGQDILEDFLMGAQRKAEGFMDTALTEVGSFVEKYGSKENAEGIKKLILENKVDKQASMLDRLADEYLPSADSSSGVMKHILQASEFHRDREKNSVLGAKSDSVVQAAGDFATQVGLSRVMPWQVATGLSSYGMGAEEALTDGASFDEARTYGLISAGADIASEYLAKGINFGSKTLNLGGNTKDKLLSKMSNKVAKTVLQLGFDAAGEGFEEVVADVAKKVGQHFTYKKNEELKELLASDEALEGYLDSFIGGALISGGYNLPKAARSIKTGRDYDTGFSDNEQTLINREVSKRVDELRREVAVKSETEKRITEHPAQSSLNDIERNNIRKAVEEEFDNGELDISSTQLSKKELNEIEEQVTEDLKKGYFDIDTIESIFAEAKTSRISELKAEMSKPLSEDKKAEIQKEIDQLTLEKNKEMQKFVEKDYWLQESYRQELLKGKSFERESRDTDSEITKELEESAKAAGMNNTRKMHELFEYTNKIANDTDTKYGFINSKQLKSMGYSVEDATINGMVRVQEDGSTKVLINVDSGKALNTIIGHETTHLLEGTQEHKDLIEAVKEYAQMKGDYDGRIKAVTELYRNVDANIENEVTADLVGDYIFTDEQFVMNLTKKPNVFQKVYDYIKHAYKMATAGSAEARQLLKAKRAFERAYKNMPNESRSHDSYLLSKSIVKATDKHSKEDIERINAYLESTDDKLLGFVHKVMNLKDPNIASKLNHQTSMISDREIQDIQREVGVNVEGYKHNINGSSVRHIEKRHGKNGEHDHSMAIAEDVARMDYVLRNYDSIEAVEQGDLDDEVIAVAKAWQNSDQTPSKLVRYKKKINGTYYVAVAVPDSSSKRLQVISAYIEKHKKIEAPELVNMEDSPHLTSKTFAPSTSEDIISQNNTKNNEKNSLSESEYKAAAERGDTETAQRLVDETAKNAGYTIKAYHGTGHDFTVFDEDKQGSNYADWGRLGRGFYFAPKEKDAKMWAERSQGDKSKVLSVYLKDENLIDAYEPLPENLIETIPEEWDSFTKRMASKYTYNYIEFMQEQGYDVQKIMLDKGYAGVVAKGSEYVMFNPEHIKSADAITYDDQGNVVPLSERFDDTKSDIRFSLSESDDIAPVSGYAVYGKDVKLTDEDILPIRDDIAPVRTVDNDVEEADPTMFEGEEAVPDYDDRTVPMDKESMRLLTKNMKEVLGLNQTQRSILKGIIQDYSTGKIATPDDLYAAISEQFGAQTFESKSEELQATKKALRETRMKVSDELKDSITDYFRFRQSNFGKLRIANEGMAVDDLYGALNEVFPGYFPDSIDNQEDQLYRMAEVAGMDGTIREEYVLPEEKIAEATDFIRESVSDYKRGKRLKASLDQKYRDATPTRKEIHAAYVKKIKDAFAEKGMNFDSVLANGKNLSTFASVDNTPQRFMEKTFGYKEGQLLSDLTVNQAAENETEAIRWLNSFTNKKNGTLAKLSKKYNIKPFSKEDAAAQKYAEGMYVNQYGDYVEYGDRQLEFEIKDPQMRANIKAFVADPTLRKIYDETLDAINASRTRNGYPAIPRRKDYFLHFREMDDTFSKIGIPFNPNDIKAKDLPTDINGMTADNKPGQPWFGSQMQRKGVGTTYSLLGGMERYLTAAKPQIYHIDDIQILRALRNSVADTYGQAKGLESLDEMTDEEAEARIEQVYGAHLSTFAKFLNEEANIMAGKTALIDRGMEGILGRRAISFMNTLNSQVAKNMIGFNLSSSLTNFVSVTQAAAKASKYDVIKAFAQTTSNKVKNIFGHGDGFAEQNSAIVRRKGQDKFYKKPWERVSDTGFIFMSAIDDISTEFIVRTKYNELTRKGMSEKQAHDEAGKWAMRILGDRSFGQMPQIFNSKTLGLVTKFQLEVRNQLDSMFYDTVQEANVSAEEIQSESRKNAVKAAKITSTMVQLAVFQHLFGKAFESVAGYNPTFDIIENLMILFGFDDEEDSEDTFTDNLEEALLGLGEDLPYFSALTGGRIPIESALPIEQFVQGTDDYGNEKPRLETVKEALPYYLFPTGYGQLKKGAAGLKMFDDDLPLPGSYTDSGNLRFPVEPTPQNIIQAGLFGQWANENAREYFDGEHQPLKEKQIQEFKDLDLPIADYWKIREEMSGLTKAQQKVDYINDLDLPISKKNILANNALNRDEEVDLTNYDDYGSLAEMDFAVKHPDTYAFAKSIGGYQSHQVYSKALSDIHADKDENGKSINGSRKEKVIDYINSLDADYYTKIILYKSEYNSDDSYNNEIIEYLRERDDINDEEMKTILMRLGFTVDDYGNVGW